MAEPQEIIIHTPGYEIAAKAWGPESGKKVISVHGWMDNAASFDLIAPLLPELRLIAIDMPGHGRSSHRAPGVPYHFVDFVADVVAVADSLDWQHFSLVSHSLGAAISSFVSSIIPERIEYLALIEGLGPFSGEPEKAPEVLATSIKQMKKIAGKAPPIYPNIESIIEARVRVGDLEKVSAARLIERGSQICEGGVTWTSDPRLRFTSPQYLTEKQVLAHLRAIEAPCLLVNGENGIISERVGIKQRYASVSNLKIETLPGGHHLHMENPQPVAEAIGEFLTQ